MGVLKVDPEEGPNEGRRLIIIIIIITTIHYLYSAVYMALRRLIRNIRTLKKKKYEI